MNTNVISRSQKRKGFTLVELVVVILVMGIVAAVAAPKMFDTAKDARENSTKQSLVVVRNAIQLYKSKTGSYPGEGGEADLKADLALYIQGQFPINQISDAANDGSVAVDTAGTALAVSGTQDWKYDSTSGEFIINTTGYGTY